MRPQVRALVIDAAKGLTRSEAENAYSLSQGRHDTSRIAWVKLVARVGEEFPLECQGAAATSGWARRDSARSLEKRHSGGRLVFRAPPVRDQETGHSAPEPLINPTMVARVPLTGLSSMRRQTIPPRDLGT